ncbi:MAG: hypothetical protein GC168_18805 [Candidatus Hydrogenedens sp.]|nr:hypothetical protein [Candidatus Hydrogenedens sp.]
MATAIGQNLSAFYPAQGGTGEAAQLAASAAARGVRIGSSGEAAQQGINPSATGLQDNAVNGPSAAQRTILQGVESARRIVPDVKDILDIQRQRVAESEAARQAQLEEARAQEDARAQDTERSLPEPSRDASRFAQTRPEDNTQSVDFRQDVAAASRNDASQADRNPAPQERGNPVSGTGARLDVLV